jgi:hypothetical protein
VEINKEETKIENMKKFVEKAKELEKEVSSKNQLDDSVFIGFHKLFREF